MPHLHLSLQAGDDMILKRMKRRHLRADAIRFCDDVRTAAGRTSAFGADLIAGFPTETEAMFENTASIVEECGLAYLHVFPFSARTGTPAARMPQLPRRARQGSAPRACARPATARWRAASPRRWERSAPSWSSGRASAAPSISHPLRSMQARPARSCRYGWKAPARASSSVARSGKPHNGARTKAGLLQAPLRLGRPFGADRSRTLPTPQSSWERRLS